MFLVLVLNFSLFWFIVANSRIIKMESDAIINTEYGFVRGIESVSALGKPFISFFGIPYAAPPVGNHRFKVSSGLKNF